MHATLDRSNQVLKKTGKSSFRIAFFGRSSYLKNLQNNDGHQNLKNLELIKREIKVSNQSMKGKQSKHLKRTLFTTRSVPLYPWKSSIFLKQS
jgi:hypothetical protein